MILRSEKDFKNRLSQTFWSSCAVLLLALTASAMFLSAVFVDREQERSQLFQKTVGLAMQTGRSYLKEEVWTERTAAVEERVASSLKAVKADPKDLLLVDRLGRCLLFTGAGEQCRAISTHFLEYARIAKSLPPDESSVVYNKAEDLYFYLSRMSIGDLDAGILVVSFEDAVGLYRGGAFQLFLEAFAPFIFLFVMTWVLWTIYVRKNILRPYLTQLVNEQKDSAIRSLVKRVVHDIRGPTTSLAVLARTSQTLETEEKRLLNSCLNRIHEIVDDLLSKERQTISSQQNKSPDMKAERVCELLEEVLFEKKPLAREKETEIYLEVGKNGRSVMAQLDPIEFKRNLSNLLDNALESVMKKGHLTVTLYHLADSKAVLTIRDNGKGIDPRLLENIGYSGASFGKPKGHGIGLFNAKKYFEEMGGHFSVQSDVDLGTEIRIEFPRSS